MMRTMVVFFCGFCFFLGSATPVIAGAAVAMQNKKGPPGMPQKLPPGYVVTPQGIKKIEPPAVTLAGREENIEPVDPAEVRDIVDLEQLTESLRTSSEAWPLIISAEDKEVVVQYFIDQFTAQGIVIKKPAAYYAQFIDEMGKGGSEMLAMPFDRVLQVVAVMDYDFANGQNPDLLAQKMLGQKAYEKNKQRHMQSQQMPR